MKTVVVIGLGAIAARHRKNVKQLFPEAKVFAVSASGRALAQPIDDAEAILLPSL